MKKNCEYKECKKEFLPSKHGLQKYCNDICRSRANSLRHRKNAKELICAGCGNAFKRKSAKDTKCVECRTPKALKRSLAKQCPAMEREIEVDLIQEWLSNPKNKVKTK